MKPNKTLLYGLFAFTIAFSSCTLDEHPSFPNSETLFSTEDGTNTVLNGCYSGLNEFNYYGADYLHLATLSSGLYSSNKKDHYSDILAFNILPSMKYVENFWAASYRIITKTSSFIDIIQKVELPNPESQANLLGQAYFLRGLVYFNLVRFYGGVPLVNKTVDSKNLYHPRATEAEVYDQIISDLEKAENLLYDKTKQTKGRPANLAAKMLLAKVYMTLAGNQKAGETQYWQNAYDKAIQVYQQYTLVDNYKNLWEESTSNNTSESIFEVYGNIEYTLRMHQLYTPSNGNKGQTVWGRIKPNIECYSQHATRYPGDPRFGYTFLTTWTKYAANGTTSTIITYPTFTARGNQDKSYPWFWKYYIKDHTRTNYNTTQSFVVMRYAELLLMLAEIENEISGPGGAYKYVNEVLLRARNSAAVPTVQPMDWTGMTQDQFRTNIMNEYRFEMLGEGQEWFHERRRGYDYFKANVIDKHNSAPYDFTKAGDILLPDNPRIMKLPIPESEIIANPLISAEHQNIGY